MKNKTPIICAKCGREFDGNGWDEITYHKCVKPIRTNADRIRAMSDDQLHVLLVDFACNTKKLSQLREWLGQEVE